MSNFFKLKDLFFKKYNFLMSIAYEEDLNDGALVYFAEDLNSYKNEKSYLEENNTSDLEEWIDDVSEEIERQETLQCFDNRERISDLPYC